MAVGATGNYPDIIDSRPLRTFQMVNAQNPKSYTSLFTVVPVGKAFVDNIRFSGLGRFKTKLEGAAVQYDTPVQGQRMRTTMATFALGTQFTMEAIEDAQFNVLERQVEALSRSQIDHEERLAWGGWSDSFDGNSTGIGIDNVSVISTVHPLLKPPTAAITTTSNELAPGAALSTTSLEAMLIIMSTQISEEGHQIGASLVPRFLVVPSSLMHVAHTVLDTVGRPGGDLNDINTLSRFNMQPIVSPYLDDVDTNDFWISAADTGWEWYNRMSAEMTQSVDAETGNRKWRMWYRANIANVKHLNTVGSQV